MNNDEFKINTLGMTSLEKAKLAAKIILLAKALKNKDLTNPNDNTPDQNQNNVNES